MKTTCVNLVICLVLTCCQPAQAQGDFNNAFKQCKLRGSITVFDYQRKKWLYSDTADSRVAALPASTFKIINLLIALETQVAQSEMDTVRWVGSTDTTLYGYRPEIYHDMTIKEAFEVSAGWVFIELSKKIGREKYAYYLNLVQYGNGDLSASGADFWNFGKFAVTPQNQVEFLIRLYEGKLPFSKRNMAIVKKVLLTEQQADYSIYAKTGWTRDSGIDTGWWVGYTVRKKKFFFFATRVTKLRSEYNPDFAKCRKEITKKILIQLGALQ